MCLTLCFPPITSLQCPLEHFFLLLKGCWFDANVQIKDVVKFETLTRPENSLFTFFHCHIVFLLYWLSLRQLQIYAKLGHFTFTSSLLAISFATRTIYLDFHSNNTIYLDCYTLYTAAAQSLVQLLHDAVDDEVMSQFVQTFLLESNSTAVRWQAHELLYSMHKYVTHCTYILCLWSVVMGGYVGEIIVFRWRVNIHILIFVLSCFTYFVESNKVSGEKQVY